MICNNCMTKVARAIVQYKGGATTMEALICYNDNLCKWEEFSDHLINIFNKDFGIKNANTEQEKSDRKKDQSVCF